VSGPKAPDGSPIEAGAPPVRAPGRSEDEQTAELEPEQTAELEPLQSEPTAPLEPVEPTAPQQPVTNMAAAEARARRATSPHFHAAICQRCGGGKRGPFVPCKSCGFTPTGAERHVAWLFSEHHLDAEELAEAAQRIREGERPDPPRSLLEQARIEMGAAPLSDIARAPLHGEQIVLLTAANLLLTPLAGLALWWGLRADRPVAARQALRLTLPVGIGLAVVWAGLLLNWTAAQL